MQNGRKMLQSCHKHTHIHLLMGGLPSSSPLNLHWDLTLVWTLRGCRRQIVLSQMCLSLRSPLSSVTPSLHPFLLTLLYGTTPHWNTHTHTHLSTENEGQMWSHPGLLLTLYSLTNCTPNSPCVTWSNVGNTCFPVLEMVLIHVNNWFTGSILDLWEHQQLSRYPGFVPWSLVFSFMEYVMEH